MRTIHRGAACWLIKHFVAVFVYPNLLFCKDIANVVIQTLYFMLATAVGRHATCFRAIGIIGDYHCCKLVSPWCEFVFCLALFVLQSALVADPFLLRFHSQLSCFRRKFFTTSNLSMNRSPTCPTSVARYRKMSTTDGDELRRMQRGAPDSQAFCVLCSFAVIDLRLAEWNSEIHDRMLGLVLFCVCSNKQKNGRYTYCPWSTSAI